MKIPYDPTRHLIGGEFAWAQDPYIQAIEDQYNAHKPVRIIILKARQLGFSTITEGVLFNWLFLHPGTHALVLAHESDTTEELFAKTKVYWEQWPFANLYNLKSDTKSSMHWLETKSQIKIATAGNRVTGRGHTAHAIHLSEVAFYPDPKKLMLGLQQSLPEEHGTFLVVESTANGVGNYFYDMWNDAVSGESDYQPMFFPWWRHPEYRRKTTLTVRSELDADERWLLKEINKNNVSDAMMRIQWRRYMLKNKVADLQEFMQEYPASPEEAFISSGHPVFNHYRLRDCYHDSECRCSGGMRGYLKQGIRGISFHRDKSGPWRIFKTPSTSDRSPYRYFVGATANEAIYGGDCSIQIIRRDTNEQVAVFSHPMDPHEFGDEILKAGYYYNEAMICPEAEGSGQETMSTVLEANYPSVWLHTWADKTPGKKSTSYGWSMNYNRKKWAVGRLQYLFNKERLLIHDPNTYQQLRDYSHWGGGVDMGNADPDGDESAVLALAIACRASNTEPPYIPNNYLSDQPVLDIFTQLDEQGIFTNA